MTDSGYARVRIYSDKPSQYLLIHRLVACAFLGLDLSDTSVQVHHKDEDKLNNRVDNLEIKTKSERSLTHYDYKYVNDSPTHKQCRTCNELKPISEYTAQKEARDGLVSQCRACIRAYYKLRGKQ